MRFRNVQHLASAQNSAAIIFLAQRLDELTFDYSLDSHKAPAVNVPALVAELLEQVETIQEAGGAISENTAEPILAELKSRLAANPIVRSIIPDGRNVLGRLGGSFDLVASTLKILEKELNPLTYTSTIMKLLIKAVEDGEKSEIDFLAKELVATLENEGMSRAHIYFANKRFFYEQRILLTKASDLSKFFEEIFPHYHEFTVALRISAFGKAIDDEHFTSFGLELKTDVRDDFDNLDPAHEAFELDSSQVFLLCEDIKAYDRYSAIEEAVEKASLLQNLFRFYHHAETFQIDDKVIVAQCCIDQVAVCSRFTNKMLNVEDERPAKAAVRLKHLISNSKLIRGKDSSRFISLSEFHGMGLDSATVENQIINLWISLETIAPSKVGHSKIDNVLSAMLPVTALSYTRRLVRRAAVDLFTWSRFRTAQSLKGVEPAIDEPYGRVLSVLTIPAYNAELQKLFDSLQDFELLRYRLFRLYQVFSNPAKLAEFLISHQQRVAWQIRRIYRARNSIVHRGKKPSYANQLVDNAHDYLDQAIHLTIEVSSGLIGLETYTECFDFLRWEQEVYMKRLTELTSFEANTARHAIWARRPVIGRSDVLWLAN